MSLFNRNTWFRKGLRGDGWITPEYFGTTGSLGVDDWYALQSAHDAMANIGGGKVILGPKTYRSDATVNLSATVSWHGVANATCWYINHAARDLHQWTVSGSGAAYAIVENITFGALVANTGIAVKCPSGGVQVQYRNCGWNLNGLQPLLQGNILSATGAGNKFVFDRCYIAAVADSVLLSQAGGSSRLKVKNSSLVMPDNYNQNLVSVSQGRFEFSNNYFDFVAHSTGSGNGLYIASTGGWHSMNDNQFVATQASGAACIVTSGSNIQLNESGSIFDPGVTVAYNIGTKLAKGSSLTLRPYAAIDVGSAPSFTLPNGYRSVTAKSAATNAPTVNLPTPLFEGQLLDFMLYNLSGGSWLGTAGIGNFGSKASVPSPVGNNQGLSARFVASDPKVTNTLEWHQIGGWAITAP